MRILIVGVLNGYVSTAAKIALAKGAKVSNVDTIEEAMEALRSGKGSDLVMVDLKLNIKALVDSLEQERIFIPVVACGIAANPKEAADAIRHGAKEYIPLPPDPELIAAVLSAVAQEEKPFICNDPRMLSLVKLVDKIAPSEANVLITGESGTGKEVLAHYIHKKSKRANNPFISLNCAAIPENLLESELFGHEKGAFTGAVARRIGKFEEAEGGTLLLDEVTEMHPRLQAKLLRAIQERVIDRVGGSMPVKVNIRIIATSNRHMLDAVKANEFREDLYFRLNVVNAHIPPLRERVEDIVPLAQHFIEKYVAFNSLDNKKLSDSATQALRSHPWPGNVRELENSMHRAVLLSQDTMIKADDILGLSTQQKVQTVHDQEANPVLVGRKMSDVEQELIIGTLNHCFGNRTHAANILGISIRTLRNKLREYSQAGITIPAHLAKG
jgi:two-component system response regulator FlrC